MNIQFFWEKKAKKSGTRSRFNLLLLEYGEYYLEDFSAYQFGIGTGESINEDLKIQGRLKMSSRSLVFEPNEVRYPLLRFPYKYMQTDLVELKPEKLGLSVALTGVFTFSCTQYSEMKAHNKIGAFKVVELPRSSTPVDTNTVDTNAFRFVFALVHSRLEDLQLKVEQFRHIVKLSERMGMVVANQHLRPFIEHALISTFDSSNLVDFHEKYLLNSPLTTRKILPLISNPGSLMITESRLYFQPAQLNNIGDASQKFELRKVSRMYKRRYLLRSTGLEFFLEDGSSYLFVFESREERDHVYELIHTKSAYSRRPVVTLDEITRKWQRREITNFQYIMHLNNEAGRTTNDLTQYPVFPHIISDYHSKKLNFESSAIYRDLSKPIGALNHDRLEFFRERFESMPPADANLGLPPPFLYGTHYSTPGYVLFYLVRVAPEYMLCLQNGRFDTPDRMFHSVSDMWDSCLHNPADLKELVPEFFTGTGDFLSNADDLDLGHRSSGERLHDVVLPPWADSPRDFIRKHAKALESEYVSDHLHAWIDLIFGYKQQGEEAIAADNLFYHLTYEKAVDLDAIKDARERAAIENQIQEFGQTPSQLFVGAHPRRNDLAAPILTTQSAELLLATSNNNNNLNANNNTDRSSLSPSPSSSQASANATTPNHSNATHSSSSSKNRPGSWNSLLGGGSSSKDNINNNSNSNKTVSSPPTTMASTSNSLSSAFSSILQPRPVSSVNRLINISSQSPVPAPRPGTPILSNNGYDSVGALTAAGSTSGNHMLPDEVPLIHLGDDFRQALESELVNGEDDADNHDENNDKKGDRSLSFADINDESNSNSSSNSHRMHIDPAKLRLFPSELFYWHTKAVTDITLRVQRCEVAGGNNNNTSNGLGDMSEELSGSFSHLYLPLSGRRKLNAVLATVSKDSLLKIVRLEQDLDLSQLYHNNSPAGNTNNTVSRTQCTISRSFSASGSSLSACALSQDGLKVVLGSWDNHVYGYNISSATAAGKKFAHYDSVTALCLDEHDSMLATASLDGTVKLWPYRTSGSHTSSHTSSGVSSAASFLPGGALVEFEDHELPVVKVAITLWDPDYHATANTNNTTTNSNTSRNTIGSNSANNNSANNTRRLVAGGAEDGSLVVWETQSQRSLFSYQCSPAKRSITALLWLYQDRQTPPRLMVATQDGKLLCLCGVSGELLAALQVDVALLCLGSVSVTREGSVLLLGGCVDGSVRLWQLHTVNNSTNNANSAPLREVQRWLKAHNGAVTALSVAAVSTSASASPTDPLYAMPCEMMVTGSEDCSVKIWRIAFER